MNKYIEFIQDKDESDEIVEDIKNKKHGEQLAKIYHHSNWNKYIVDFGDVFFDAECLIDIANHLKELDKVKRLGL